MATGRWKVHLKSPFPSVSHLDFQDFGEWLLDGDTERNSDITKEFLHVEMPFLSASLPEKYETSISWIELRKFLEIPEKWKQDAERVIWNTQFPSVSHLDFQVFGEWLLDGDTGGNLGTGIPGILNPWTSLPLLQSLHSENFPLAEWDRNSDHCKHSKDCNINWNQ